MKFMELYVFNDYIKVTDLNNMKGKLIYIGVYSPFESFKLSDFKENFIDQLKNKHSDFNQYSRIKILSEQDWTIEYFIYVFEQKMYNKNKTKYIHLPKEIIGILNNTNINDNDKKYILKNIMNEII